MLISRSLTRGAVALLAAAASTLAAVEPSASGAGAANPPLVTLAAGSSRQIYTDRPTVQARFPLELRAGVTTRRLRVTVIEVSSDQRSAAAAAGAFVASLARPSPRGLPPALVVTVNLTSAVRPATYDLVVRFRVRPQPQRKDPPGQKVAVSVVVPAAQLRAPGTLAVERTLSCFIGFLCGSHDDKPKLELIETSGESRLSNVVISDVGEATQDNRPTTARLEFTPPPKPIPPNGAGSATYSIAGELKPGTATGALRVEANELQSGVEATWSLRVRRSGWDLLVVGLAGLVFGLVTRILLQRMIDGGRARAAAGRLRRQLEEERRQRPDPAFQQDVANLETALRAASGLSSRPSRIADAVNTASQGLATALTKLEGRRAAAAAEQERLDRLLSARFALPQPIQAARLSAREAFDAAQKELDLERFSVALDKQQGARTTLVENVASAARIWAGQVDETLTVLSTATAPSELRTALTAAIDRTRAALDALTAVDPAQPERADLPAVFRAAEDALAGVAEVKLVVEQVDRTIAEVRAALGSGADLGDVDSARARLNEVLGQDDCVGELGAAVNGLLEALAGAIRAAAPQPDTVDELLAAGRYADAARTAVRTEEETVLSAGRATEAQPAPLLTLRLPALEREGVVTDVRSVAPLTAVFASPVVVQLLGTLEYIVGRLLQWALLSVVFLFLAWALFSDNFVGTSNDLAKVFLWAFALDLSGNTLVDSAKGLRSS